MPTETSNCAAMAREMDAGWMAQAILRAQVTVRMSGKRIKRGVRWKGRM